MSMVQTRDAVVTHDRATTLVQDISLVVLASGLMALCAHVSLPLLFSPVPLTLQTFGVMLIALTLGAKRGAAAMALYLVEGFCGFPVFSPAGPGGIAQIIGPTGGFLMSYPFVAFLIGSFYERKKSLGMAQIACLAGTVIFLISGMSWLAFVAHVSFATAFNMAILPFIPGEILKTAAAAYIGRHTNGWLARLYA